MVIKVGIQDSDLRSRDRRSRSHGPNRDRPEQGSEISDERCLTTVWRQEPTWQRHLATPGDRIQALDYELGEALYRTGNGCRFQFVCRKKQFQEHLWRVVA